MVNKQHDLISGEMVFMKSTTTPIATLEELMADNNLSGEWLHARPAQALQHVLRAEFLSGGEYMVRKTAGHNTFEVVRVRDLSEARNKYRNIATYRTNAHGQVEKLDDWSASKWIPAPATMTLEVQRVMECCLGLRVSSCLFKVMQANFGAVRVSRGAYFIPAAHLEKWNKFANDWISKTSNELSRIQSGCDSNTAIAVVGGAKEDLQKRYNDTQKAIKENDSRKVCKSQQKRKSHLAKELMAIEQTAIDMGKAFSVAITLADEIKSDAKLEQALALI